MFEWIFVKGDILGLQREAIAMDFIAFLVAFMVSWLVVMKLLLKRIGKEKLDAYAKKGGFIDYSDMYFFFTRNAQYLACLFLVFVFMIFFFTHLLDVSNTYQCAQLGEWRERFLDEKLKGLNNSEKLFNITFSFIGSNGTVSNQVNSIVEYANRT
ncbi:hypothetical protein DRQ25_14060 [Candidatus Fermentibacteria bacterium]|nr:MAG: hypothetical protein DRQ25_14060 [Candidatus Fermentibacteria bacterium]